MMSWKNWLIGLALAVPGISGCRQQSFLTEPDYHDFRALAHVVALESDPDFLMTPLPGTTPPPTTVDDTQRAVRYLSLREAIAIALENGTIGIQNPALPGTAIDNLGGFVARTVQSADSIRVLAIDPAILANDIEVALSKFDTLWNNSLTWSRTQTPLGLTSASLIGLVPRVSTVATDGVSFNTGLVKPLPTGGVAGITFGIMSQRNTPSGPVNPVIQPDIQFNFEQPLLQGFGDEINQLRDTHPGSVLTPFAVGGQVEGILITRIRLDQQRAEFERALNFLLLNVEAAYWNLYGAYYQLYSREEGMRYTYEYWRLTKQLFENGRAPIQTLEQIRLQYEQFRSQRLAALGQVLESERQLRGLLGLKAEDGFRLVPADSPTLTPVKVDWQLALDDALARRPELLLARQDLKFRELELIRLRNNLLPDLRFIATDQVHAVGSRLDGGESPNNALHNLFSNPFNNWSLGLQMNVPIGFRAAHAAVRDAQLSVQRSYLSLRTDEDKAERFLAFAYRQLFEFQNQIQVNRAALLAATGQLQGYIDLFRLGRAAAADANLILALQNYSNSVGSYYAAIVQYNNALATFEFAKGAIMERDSVFISEGPLPRCAQVRAVEHERQRTEALVLRDQAQPVIPASCPAGPTETVPVLPQVPNDMVLSLPVLQHTKQPPPEMAESPVASVPSPPSIAAANLGARPQPAFDHSPRH
jgi:outer membrane protein TolC